MTRIRFGRLTTVGLAVALTLATTHVRADSKQAIAAIEAAIKKNGRIPFGGTPATQTSGAAKNAAGSTGGVNSSYLKLAGSLHKATPQRLRAVSRATNQSSTSTVVTVGTAPSGFGKEFDWDRSQPSCLVAVFINVADPLGVSITGLQAGDTIQIMSASGSAPFPRARAIRLSRASSASSPTAPRPSSMQRLAARVPIRRLRTRRNLLRASLREALQKCSAIPSEWNLLRGVFRANRGVWLFVCLKVKAPITVAMGATALYGQPCRAPLGRRELCRRSTNR